MQLLVENHAVVQIFGVQGRTSCLHRGCDNQAVPVRKLVPFTQVPCQTDGFHGYDRNGTVGGNTFNPTLDVDLCNLLTQQYRGKFIQYL